ncbi:MAG: hypothetical protein OXH13_00410 [Chloroflexi bacterium]|nr:hypothetical protein [Chloroflexota bacterium]MCY3695899.1 hypothetical protein [Chloroflexota bacterium]
MTEPDTVLIVTASYDEAPSYVLPHISDRGWKSFRLDADRFPMEVKISSREDGSFVIEDGEERVRSADVRSVWYRRHPTPEFPSGLNPHFVEFGGREARAHLTGCLLGLRGVKWMSHPAALWAAEKKPYQLGIASSMGFAVPSTRVTNDAQAAKALGVPGGLVAKAVSSGYLNAEEGHQAIFTSLVGEDDLQDLDGLSLAPVIFQRWVPKRSDIRVTVVDREVFATEILSQAHPSSRIDWRATGSGDLGHRPIQLPQKEADRCVELVSRLGLAFGAVDLILDAADELQFLEINPNGEWMWIEDLAGHPISEAIARYLAC